MWVLGETTNDTRVPWIRWIGVGVPTSTRSPTPVSRIMLSHSWRIDAIMPGLDWTCTIVPSRLTWSPETRTPRCLLDGVDWLDLLGWQVAYASGIVLFVWCISMFSLLLDIWTITSYFACKGIQNDIYTKSSSHVSKKVIPTKGNKSNAWESTCFFTFLKTNQDSVKICMINTLENYCMVLCREWLILSRLRITLS
jgi:hypothetical protein